MADDEQALLSVLNAHGQDFLASFASPSSQGQKRKRVTVAAAGPSSKAARLDDEELEEEEEWLGFGTSAPASDEGSSNPGEYESDDGEDLVEDDGFTASTSTHAPNLVVFSDKSQASSSAPRPTKAQMKAFMSSKVSKLRRDVEDNEGKDEDVGDSGDERTNTQNDALLHRLVHTQLLSASLNPDLNLTPAQRKKALAGRVLELAGSAKLGKGEKAVRAKERDKAAKRVRDGMLEKQTERRHKQVQEAKDMGNYHPAIKKLFEGESEQASNRKREKGLRIGIGKFDGGILKLTRREINSVNEVSMMRGRGRGRGRGGSRGAGRGSGGGRGGRGSGSRGRGIS
ncbi:hypothetical protein BV25DRAFT_1925886 [Artomyces pyxidatus]|uniref:Uncharacterized protein n=1 Tax=Artomyces pyxidatus TaxID=48021 RepID=A0ACB8TL02_9AGAM|nr:hypothetical protein BV25DRAFT_1925886 [Artomyces pyxidatus]